MRASRLYCARYTRLNVSVGSTRWCATSSMSAKPPLPVESMERMPATGSTGNTEASKITSMIPSQNTGAAKPTSDSTVMNCDSSPLGLRDESTPSAVPTKKASSTALSTSSSVAGTRSAIMLVTGRLKKYE